MSMSHVVVNTPPGSQWTWPSWFTRMRTLRKSGDRSSALRKTTANNRLQLQASSIARSSSVVKTSAFVRRIFPYLRPIYGWRVTTLWVNCPPWVNQLGKLSLPSLRGRQISSNPCRYMDYGSGDYQNGRLGLQSKVRERRLGLPPRLNDDPVCDA